MSQLVFHAGGAHGWKSKSITLAEELRRWYLHMDSHYSIEDRKEVVMDILQKMTDSGYSHSSRLKVITSATRKYCRQLMEKDSHGQRLYRSAEDMATSRRLKEIANNSWFKSKRGGQRITQAKDIPSVVRQIESMARREVNKKSPKSPNKETQGRETSDSVRKEAFPTTIKEVEATPDSKLKRRLQKSHEKICKVTNSLTLRFVERERPTLIDIVGRNNPWTKEWSLPRENCYPYQERRLLAM